MKSFLSVATALCLGGCQTPPGIVDTATLISRMTVQLNSKVGDYVAQSNAARQNDVRRLSLEQEQAAHKAAANADQFKVLELVPDYQNAGKLFTALQGPILGTEDTAKLSAATAQARLSKEFGRNSFDQGALTAVALSVGGLGTPKDTKDEILTFAFFSRQVSDDLKAATAQAATKSSGAPSATPSASLSTP